MYRAEKASRRVCCNREGEPTQELHHRKLDGATSSFAGAASRPTALRPAAGNGAPTATFRRFKPAATSSTCLKGSCNSDGPVRPERSGNSDSDDAGDNQDRQSEDDNLYVNDLCSRSAGSINSDSSHHTPAVTLPAKTNECRVGAAVLGEPIASKPTQRQPRHFSRAPLPVAGATHKKQALNISFRTQRLQEIDNDSAGLLERIRQSAAHYRNDGLKHAWDQNVSYLSSTCTFPTAARANPQRRRQQQHQRTSEYGSMRTSGRTPPVRRHEPLPSICQPVVVHPIRAIPTSPRRLQLNLSPAFRSLRKSMPQQPALPPLTAASSNTSSVGTNSLASPSSLSIANHKVRSCSSNCNDQDSGSVPTDVQFIRTADSDATHSDSSDASSSDDGSDNDYLNDSDVAILPPRATSIGAPFIGDLSALSSPQQLGIAPSATALSTCTYQVLTLGRVVGGTYLVLTVYCGDGVTNPYGLDILAVDRASQCAFQLSITRQMARELLDATSSSSKAAATAAAAGMNVSMVQIAHCICDHVNVAVLDGGLGEMLFLTTSNDRKRHSEGDSSASASADCTTLLIDVAPPSVALCIHQCIEIEVPARASTAATDSCPVRSRPTGDGVSATHKRKLHVFASTRPQKSTRTPRDTAALALSQYDSDSSGDAQTICFQVRDDPNSFATAMQQLPMKAAATRSSSLALNVEIDLHELYATVRDHWHFATGANESQHQIDTTALMQRVSIERVVIAAIRHLHIVHVPDARSALVQQLVVKRYVNAQLRVVPPTTSCSDPLAATQSRQYLQPHAASPTCSVCLLETGVLWESAYMLACVSVMYDSITNDIRVNSDESKNTHARCMNRELLYIQDVDAPLCIEVVNTRTGRSSMRTLSPKQVDTAAEKLNDLLALGDSDTEFQESVAFAKQLLLRMELDVDLFGAEVLTFPRLGIQQSPRHHINHSSSNSSSKCLARPDVSRRRNLLLQRSSRIQIGETCSRQRETNVNNDGSSEDDTGEWNDDDEDDSDEWQDDDFDVGDVDMATTHVQAHVRRLLFRKQFCDASDCDELLVGAANTAQRCGAITELTEMPAESSATERQHRNVSKCIGSGDSDTSLASGNASAPSPATAANSNAAADASVRIACTTREPASTRSGVKRGEVFCLVRNKAASLHAVALADDVDDVNMRVVFAIGACGALGCQTHAATTVHR